MTTTSPSPADGSPPAHATPSQATPAVAPVSVVPAPGGTQTEKSTVDPSAYEQCTIVLVVQLRPQSAAGQPRQIVLSVQNGVGSTGDFPIYRLLTEAELGGPFPPAVEALLEHLRQDLPKRKAHQAARQQAAVPVSSSTTHKTAASTTIKTTGGKPGNVTSTTTPAKPATPPPMPTTSNPIPKGDLTMGGGLFEGF